MVFNFKMHSCNKVENNSSVVVTYCPLSAHEIVQEWKQNAFSLSSQQYYAGALRSAAE